MKHPIYKSALVHITREMICFTIGHNWKCSWRRKDNYDDNMTLNESVSKFESLPYRDRQSGNPYYEYSAGWHYKCRRCATRTRGEAYYPFWTYFRGTWFVLKFTAQWIFDKEESFKSKLAVLLTLPLELFWQFYYRLHEDHGLPFFPVDLAVDLKDWVFKILYDEE